MTKPRILCIGSANMDLVMKTERMPEKGETFITGRNYEFIPGGKGANAALAAARLGADTLFCTRLGDDANGKVLRDMYIKENISSRFIGTDKNNPTGLAGIFVESDATNRIIVYPGANNALTSEDLEEAFLSYPDALLMQFEIPEQTIIKACRLAAQYGVKVIIDAGPARSDFPLKELGRVEIFSPNETETLAYTGISPDNMSTTMSATVKLSVMVNAKYIVLKLGSRGAYVYDGVNADIIPSYEVSAVDTTAAGDAFTAALTYEYTKTGDIIHSIKFANAVGALTVTKMGASSSLPTYDEVMNFVKIRQIEL